MKQLFLFLYKYRVFFIFLILEIIAFGLIFQRNTYQQVAFLSSSNRVVGSIFKVSNSVFGVLDLEKENEVLLAENARLRRMVGNLYEQVKPASSTPFNKKYIVTPASVINNSVLRENNFITIDKGIKDGIKPEMGVISSDGIVGQVKACSEHFSTVYSVLYKDAQAGISSQIKNTSVLCSTKWDTNDPEKASLHEIPRNIPVSEGDTVVTSGNNAIYPGGILIGVVEKVESSVSESFQSITVNLSTNFRSLSYVYVVNNKFKAEKDSLEAVSFPSE